MKKLPIKLLFLLPLLVLGYFLLQPSQKGMAEMAPAAELPLQNKYPGMDKSPMDISYYPVNYPVLKIQGKASDPLLARVVYSRPQRNNRKIFGDLVEYGKVWRLGANEASEIEFFKDAKSGGKKISKGRYTIYCIPYETKWTIVINKENDIWGAFAYDQKKDVIRIDNVAVQQAGESVDAFTMFFEKAPGGANLVIVWEEIKVALPISF
jgi:Protein of unknown function (DUF2911)